MRIVSPAAPDTEPRGRRAWGKKAVVELDAVNGAASTGGEAFQQQMRRIFNRDVLFDLDLETVKLMGPGGAITAKIVQAIAGRGRQEKEKGRYGVDAS